jgi:predicted PurR-regulated permease PerM
VSAARGPSTKEIIRIFATVAALCALVYVLYLVRSVIWMVAIAVFVAMALGPAVGLLGRTRMPRPLAIVLVYLAIAAGIVGIGTLLVPPLVSGVKSIADNAPSYVAKLRQNKTLREYDNRYKITQKLNTEAAKLPERLGQSAGALSNVTVGVFSALFQLITVLTIAFFLLLDGERLYGAVLRVVRPHQAARLAAVSATIYRSVAGYVLGNLAISVIAGVSAWVVMTLLGVPFAVPLAIAMAFFDLIPMVGATLGSIIIALAALLVSPLAAAIWLVFSFLYQQAESYLIGPVVYRRAVQVSPMVTILAVLVGAALLGLLGALLAIPAAAAVQIVVDDLRDDRAQAPVVLTPPTQPKESL